MFVGIMGAMEGVASDLSNDQTSKYENAFDQTSMDVLGSSNCCRRYIFFFQNPGLKEGDNT